MELVARIKEGKTPFIGLLFIDEAAARETHAATPSGTMDMYQLDLFPQRDTMELVLWKNEKSYGYKGIRFDPAALDAFLLHTRFNLYCKFGHVVMENKALRLVRSAYFHVPWVVWVNRVRLVSAG